MLSVDFPAFPEWKLQNKYKEHYFFVEELVTFLYHNSHKSMNPMSTKVTKKTTVVDLGKNSCAVQIVYTIYYTFFLPKSPCLDHEPRGSGPHEITKMEASGP